MYRLVGYGIDFLGPVEVNCVLNTLYIFQLYMQPAQYDI